MQCEPPTDDGAVAFDALMLRALQFGEATAYAQCLARVAKLARNAAKLRYVDPSAREPAVQRCLHRVHAKRATYTPGSNFDAWALVIIRHELEVDRAGNARPILRTGVAMARVRG